MNEPFFLVSCSPRRGGNSDFAVRELQKALPAPCRVCRLTESGVRPCVSCASCDAHPGKCSLDGAGDGAAAMFQTMFRSRLSILVSPVYFYHIPAQAKALVDRAQRFWACGEKPGRGRALAAVLIGARPRGEKLFEGAERTLRYMALTLGMEWQEPLCLYGLDGPDALASSSESRERIHAYARRLGGMVL